MIKYIILLLLSIYSLYYIAFRLIIPFWSRQPVFHLHNLLYWINPPGIIEKDLNIDHKYYDSTIEFLEINQLSDKTINDFHTFINDEYLPGQFESYKPTKKAITSTLLNHNDKSYISLKYSFDIENNKFVNKKIIASMTTIPIMCHINNEKFKVLFTDFMCVNKKFRKKNIAANIIYTHNYNTRLKNHGNIGMFKGEGKVTLITPITIYNTYLYDLSSWPKKQKFIANNIKLILIDDTNFSLLFHYLVHIKSQFECYFQINIENLRGLIKEEIIYITMVLADDKPYGCMMFRNSFTTYDNKKSLECYGSYFDTVTDEAIRYLFYNSLLMIKNKLDFNFIWIENISHNNKILNVIFKHHTPKATTTISYYFYNYANRPFLSKSVLLLN